MNEYIDKIEPFLGRMIIKIVKENADEVMKKKYAETGVSSEFLNKIENALCYCFLL